MSELLKKYESIDQSKLNEATIKILNRVKTLTADFTVDDQKNNKIAEDVLNEIMNKNPDAIKIVKRQPKAKTAVKKPHKPKGTHKAKGETTKTTTEAKSSENNIMSIAKKIQKSGEAWKDAMERAKQELKDRKEKSVQKQKTELEKLFSLVKTKKELQGITKSDIRRDAVRTAKPRGARVVTKEGTTSNGYGTFSNKLGRKYWETRDRHADRLAPNYPKDMPLLASGGAVSDAPFSVEVFKTKLRFDNELPSSSKGDFPTFAKAKEFAIDMIDNGNYYAHINSKSGFLWGVNSDGMEQFANGGGVGQSFNDSVADKMEMISTMKSFASQVRNMSKPITHEQLSDMLPDYVSGKDISSVLEKSSYANGGSFAPNVSDGTAFMDNAYFSHGGVGTSFNDSVADKMETISTMKSFASQVRNMSKPITHEQLSDMLPDYVSGKDISSVLEKSSYAKGGGVGDRYKIMQDTLGYFEQGYYGVFDTKENKLLDLFQFKKEAQGYLKEIKEKGVSKSDASKFNGQIQNYANGGSFAPSVSDGTAFMDNAYFADGGAIKNLPRNSVSKKVKYWSGNVQTSESDLTDDIDNLGNYMDKIKLWSNPFMDYDSACLGFNFKGTQQQLKEKLMKLSEEMKKYKISGKVQDLYDDNSEDDYEYNNGEDLGWNVLIKDWYTKTYPTDDLGEEIDGGNNFKDVWLALHQGTNVYDVLGVGDSVVRERVFEELSKIFEVDYDYVYQKWLDSDNYADGGSIKDFDFSYTKIWIGNNPELSKRVQEKAFENGYRWGGSEDFVQNTDRKTMFFNGANKSIFLGDDDRKQFGKSIYFKEVTEQDIFGGQTTDFMDDVDGGGIINLNDEITKSSSTKIEYFAGYFLTNEQEDSDKISQLENLMEKIKLYSDVVYTKGKVGLGFNFKGTKQELRDKLTEVSNEMKKMGVVGDLYPINKTPKSVYDRILSYGFDRFAQGGGIDGGMNNLTIQDVSFADGGSLPFMTDPNFGDFQNTGAFGNGGSLYNDALSKMNKDLEKSSQVQRIADYHKKSVQEIVKALQTKIKIYKHEDGSVKLATIDYTDPDSKVKVHISETYGNYELGGAFMNTDLAGHTGGGTGGLDAGMPLSGTSGTYYTGLVGETGAMSSGELFMDGGAMMANQQVINDASQPYVITEALGNPAQHLAEGGSIVNQYKGRSPMDIWDNLTQAQRAHFIHDHTDEIAKDKKVEKLTARQIKNGSMNEWILTDDDIRNAFGKHIIMGQYAYGGRTKSRPSMRELYIENIAYLTNTREVGVDDFAKEHNLTDSELSNLMTGIGRKMISQSDFVTALVGDKDNAKQKEVVAFAKSDKAYKMADGGSFAPNVSDGTAFMDNAYFADGGGIMADGRIVLRTFNGVGGNENKTYSLIKDDRDSDGKPYYTLVEKPSGSIMAQGDSFQEVNNVANMFSGSFANGGSFAPNVSDGTAFMDNAYFADGGGINGMLNKKILKLAEKKGLTMDDLGRDEFNKVMTQALVESLTDANFHAEAKQVVVKAEGKTKWSDDLYRAESFNPDEKVSSFAREVSRECYWEFYDIINAYFFITKMQGSKVAKYIEDLFFKSKTTKSSSSSKLKKYIDHADIKTVTLKLKGKTVTIAGSDVLNGANLMEDGGDLSKIASYVPKRDVIEVELKDGSKIKPVNGYWVKKGAKPLSSPSATPTSKTDETKAHFQADALGNVFVDSNFVNLSKNNLPNSELKHYGFGEFYLETPDGNIDFIRTSEEIDGFVGRTHKLSGSNELIKKLVDAMKEKGRFESTQTFADGGEVRRFNRHEQMDSQTREEVLDIVSEPELKGSLTNYLYGLYDGYDYSETENFKKEMTKLKSKDSALYDRINDVYKKIDKYKFEKYDDFADGGSTGSGFDPVKVKVVLAVGIDSAIEFYDADYPIRPYQLLERAVRGGYITLDEINERVVDSAMETAQDSEDMEEVGSSDFGAYLHNFLNDAGFKVGYINSRLTREYANGGSFAPNVSDGTAFMDNAYFANGGELADIQKMKKALITKAKSRGLYENFGQKEVRVLEDKYGYTNNVRDFDNWAMNFDLSQMANGGEVGQKKYQVQYSVGKVKYLVTYHDGIQKYKDGSNINYIRTFNNKIDLKDFLTKLSKEGYKEMRYNTAFDNGGMFDDNDGFMKANNENNYRYPNKPVHVDTIDESIDLTDNVGQYPNKVVLRGLDESIDLTGSGIRARMSYNPKDRTPEKMMAVNPRMVVTDMPMTTSKKHKND